MLSRIFIFLVFTQLAFSQDAKKAGKASYYDKSFHGKKTSNGEIYNKNDFTAAHLTLPFNSILLVTNKKNNKSVVVRINDRGPFKKSRVIDLSHASAIKIGMITFGVVEVKISRLTYLDSFIFDESKIHTGDIMDCYGNKKEVSKFSIYIWETMNLKHAMYMASNLSLEYHINALIKISEKNENRNYIILADKIKNKITAEHIITIFRKSGFSKSGMYEYDDRL